MEINMTEFINIMKLKNQLIMFSSSELVEIYKDIDDFFTFLDTFILLTETDSGFLLFDDSFRDKICSVMQYHRFNCNDDIKQTINDVICYLNSISGYSREHTNLLKNGYLSYQEQMRHVEFYTTESMLASIANDAIVCCSLINGELDEIEDGDHFLMFLNYMVNVCPEFFNDKDVLKRVYFLLDKASHESRIFSMRKKYVKETKSRLVEVFKKEA